MFRFLPAFALALLPCVAAADVTCAEMQAAMKVPPPPVGTSEDPDRPLGCSRAALAMFAFNKVARDAAQPVGDLSDLHGTWLGDDVLSYVTGVTVPGQEVLIFGPGERPDTLSVTQLWMKAASPNLERPLWSAEGRYLGMVAELVLRATGDGEFVMETTDAFPRYGGRQLEFERSRDLFIKAQINHFELPVKFALHDDVLILQSELRNPVTRDPVAMQHSYTRIDPGAAELALGIVSGFELSQSRNFDCLAHQISDGSGPLFDVIAPDGRDELEAHVRDLIGMSIQRLQISERLRAAESDAERARLKSEMMASVEAYMELTREGPRAALTRRIVEGSDRFCPDFF